MTTDERLIERLNSRSTAHLVAVALVLWGLAAHGAADGTVADAHGTLFDWRMVAPDNATLSTLTNTLCLALIASMLVALNRVFNFVRSTTHIMATAFMLLSLTSPVTWGGFNVGTLLCLVFVLCAFSLFGCYQDKHAQRGTFLTFAVVSAGTMFHYAFVLLVPVFVIGCANMRILDLRGLLAALIGLLLPYWIALGTGWATPGDFTPPVVSGIWQVSITGHAGLQVGTVVATVLLALLLMAGNMVTLLNYRLQIRVYNAFFMWTTLWSVMAMAVDLNHFTDYLPLLHACVAVQVAHAFTLGRHPKRHWLFTALAAGAVAVGVYLTVWQ